jgi:hypothetical protein
MCLMSYTYDGISGVPFSTNRLGTYPFLISYPVLCIYSMLRHDFHVGFILSHNGNPPGCPVKSDRWPASYPPHNRPSTCPSSCACASPSGTSFPAAAPSMISRRSEWLLPFLVALRTALYLDCFHTKAQSPLARSSASAARVKKKKESCRWW